MQCQNKSLRSMIVQLMDELKKSRVEHSPERDNQTVQNKGDSSSETNESLKNQIDDLNIFIEKLQNENKKIKENLYEKQVSLKNCLTVLENNNSDINNLSKHVEDLCRQKDKHNDQVKALQNELVTKEYEISKLKSETEQIGILENTNSKLNCDVCCLKSQIETYSSEYIKLKCEIDTTMKYKTDLENKVYEYQNQFEELQVELQNQLKEYEDYKEEMLLIIDQLMNDLEAARVKQDSKEIQCTINQRTLCSTSTQECPIMQNRTVQSLEDFLTVCHKNTQVIDLEIIDSCKKSFGKKIIKVEVHKQELQTLNNEFLQYRCVMDYRIQSLEKDNNELKENLSILSNDHERNVKKVEEEYYKCQHELATKVKVLEEDNSILRNSLASETNCIKSELERVKNENKIYVCQYKNKINELELDNTGLRDTLSNMINENRDTLKKVEENYSLCKRTFKGKIKQLEEENHHLRETLDIVTTEDNKSIEGDFNTLKTVLENKIRSLEKENNYLKEIVNCTANDYEAKLTTKEAEKKELEDNLSKETAHNQTIIKNLIDEQNQYLQSIMPQILNSDSGIIDLGEKFNQKTVLKLKIKQLIENKLKLYKNLAKISSENVSYLKKIEELSKSINNPIHGSPQKISVLTCLLDQVNQTDEIKENENIELKEEFNEMQKKLLTLEIELKNANLRLTEYEEENKKYSQRLQILINEMTSKLYADTDINDFNMRIIQLQEEIALISKGRDQTIAELNNKFTELECKIVNFVCNVSKLKESKEENEQLENKLDNIETMLNNVRRVLDSLHSENSQIKSLEMLVHEMDEQIKGYFNELNAIQKQLEGSKSKCQEYKIKIQELESEKEMLEGKIIEYEKSMKETSRETCHLRKLISDLEEGRIITLEEENNKEVLEQLYSVQEQIKSLKKLLKNKNAIIRDLQELIYNGKILLQHCEKEMKFVQKNNKILKNELENNKKDENSFLKAKSLKLFEENQLFIEQLNNTPNRYIDKETLKLKIDYYRLLKESQAKDINLKNLKQQLMLLLAGKTKKPVGVQKSVFELKTKRSKHIYSKFNGSARYPHFPNALQAIKDLKSESLLNTLSKRAVIKNKLKDVSVYLALGHTYPSKRGSSGIKKTRAVPGDAETVSRVYGGASGSNEIPRNDLYQRKPSKNLEKSRKSYVRSVYSNQSVIRSFSVSQKSNKSKKPSSMRQSVIVVDKTIKPGTSKVKPKQKSLDSGIWDPRRSSNRSRFSQRKLDKRTVKMFDEPVETAQSEELGEIKETEESDEPEEPEEPEEPVESEKPLESENPAESDESEEPEGPKKTKKIKKTKKTAKTMRFEKTLKTFNQHLQDIDSDENQPTYIDDEGPVVRIPITKSSVLARDLLHLVNDSDEAPKTRTIGTQVNFADEKKNTRRENYAHARNQKMAQYYDGYQRNDRLGYRPRRMMRDADYDRTGADGRKRPYRHKMLRDGNNDYNEYYPNDLNDYNGQDAYDDDFDQRKGMPRVRRASKSRKMYSFGTDPIKPLRASVGVTVSPETSLSTDSKPPTHSRGKYTMDTGIDPIKIPIQKSVQTNKFRISVPKCFPCPNICFTRCSHWAQPDYSDESDSDFLYEKYICLKDSECFVACHCEEEESSSSHVSC